MNAALLIIDIQNDYFPGGRMELVGSVAASLRARALLEAFRARGLPVIHVQHVSTRPGATFFLPDTDGVRIHENVRPAPGETVLTKHSRTRSARPRSAERAAAPIRAGAALSRRAPRAPARTRERAVRRVPPHPPRP